jgi:hypothetical protein
VVIAFVVIQVIAFLGATTPLELLELASYSR